ARGVLHQPLEAGVHGPERVGLLEERVRRLVWRREQDDALDSRRDALQRGRGRRERQNPHQEQRVDPVETAIERVGSGEVAARDLDVGRQVRGFRVAAQGPHATALGAQEVHHRAADVPGRSGDEHPQAYERPSARRLARILFAAAWSRIWYIPRMPIDLLPARIGAFPTSTQTVPLAELCRSRMSRLGFPESATSLSSKRYLAACAFQVSFSLKSSRPIISATFRPASFANMLLQPAILKSGPVFQNTRTSQPGRFVSST